MDEIDVKILKLVQEDARLTPVEIAPLVHLSRTPVAARLRKLRQEGVIRSFISVLDRQLIGQPVLVITHVKLEKQSTEYFNDFENAVCQMPEVQFLLHVSGGWNFILHITAKSPQAYFDFIMENINALGNIAHMESCFVMKECKSNGPFKL